MTQEEKAKRYDEALHKAKNYYSTTDSSSDIKLIGLIFPELKESEDEKIRKELIKFVKSRGGFKQEYIAWLEKQGEHAKFRDSIQVGDEVTRNSDGVIVNLSQLKRVAKKDEKQGEQKSQRMISAEAKEAMYGKTADKVEPKFKVKYAGSEYNVLDVKDIAGVTYYVIEDEPNNIDYVKANSCEIINVYSIKGNGSPYPTKPAIFAEHKSSDEAMKEALRTEYEKGRADAFVQMQKEWSEEDKDFMYDTLSNLTELKDRYGEGYGNVGRCIDWVKDLKNRVQPQPKQEWSEEDENGLGDALWCCKQAASIAKDENDMGNVWYAEHWLKSLKDRAKSQNTWKPSGEQMEVLAWCKPLFADPKLKGILESLIEDLKKLREE